MTTTTRRTILAGAATLPLLPAAALAVPVTLPLLPVSAFATPAESDPVIPVFREWQETFRDFERTVDGYAELERRYGGCCGEAYAFEASDLIPASDRRSAVERRIAPMIPTTLAGLVGLLTVAVASVDAHSGGEDDINSRLLVSMLAGAERMAREGMS